VHQLHDLIYITYAVLPSVGIVYAVSWLQCCHLSTVSCAWGCE